MYFDIDRTRTGFRERVAGWGEIGVLVCLAILAAGLPYAGFTFSRELGLMLGLIFWLARLLAQGKWDLVRTPLDLPLALFFVVGLLSLFTAVDPCYSANELRGEMLKGILIYYLAVNNIRTEARARLILGALLAGVLVMDLYGVIHFFTHDGNLLSARPLREASLHRSNQELGTYLVQVAPYIMMGIVWLKERRVRLALTVLVALHYLLAYMTFSRMIIVVLVFEAALVLFLLGMSWKMVLGGLAVVVLGLALALPRPIIMVKEAGKKEYQVGIFSLTGLKGSRFELWLTAFKYIKEHPFAGLGFGRRSYTKKFPEMRSRHQHFWHAHNTFLNLTVELGIQGLVVFCFLLYRILRRLWMGRGRGAIWWRTGIAGPLLVATWIMTAGFFLRNTTDDIYNNDAALLFWMLVGCAFSMRGFVLGGKAGNAGEAGP